MVWDFIQTFNNVSKRQNLYADDNVSKLNRKTTVSILIIVALFMTAKGYSADQIECNTESNTISVTKSYVNSICWVKDIYQPENFDSQHPNGGIRFNFYPWLPVITLFLAFCYYLPYLVWKAALKFNMYQHMPIDVNSIVTMLNKSTVFEKKNFNSNIEKVSDYLEKCFSLNNFHNGYESDFDDVESLMNHKRLLGKDPKNFVTRMKAKRFFVPLFVNFLLVKFTYLLVSVGIFGIIDLIFRFENTFYVFGYRMIYSLYFETNDYDKSAYLNSSYFPRVVMCNIHSKEDMRNSKVEAPYQCVLSSNFLNEKIFIVLWLWFCLIALFNFFSLLRWTFIIVSRKRIIKEMLSWPFDNDYNIKKFLDQFVYNYLSTEGVLVLMLIKSNTQDWHCRMIINILWKNFVKYRSESEMIKQIEIDQDNLKFYEREHMNVNKSPISSQTIKCEGRRKLNMDMNSSLSEFSPVSKSLSNSNKNEPIYKNNNQIERSIITNL